jgi:hypothetical protein
VYRDETIATVRERLRRLEGAHQADIENGYWVFFWYHQVMCLIIRRGAKVAFDEFEAARAQKQPSDLCLVCVES